MNSEQLAGFLTQNMYKVLKCEICVLHAGDFEYTVRKLAFGGVVVYFEKKAIGDFVWDKKKCRFVEKPRY
ncbi:MAG: hypothetical protein NTW11_03410 [Candidatus Staskawiczbacteria bacterium]|nr:hypothetical protein [Candidatus Staskawiczbacteria bacterium]